MEIVFIHSKVGKTIIKNLKIGIRCKKKRIINNKRGKETNKPKMAIIFE